MPVGNTAYLSLRKTRYVLFFLILLYLFFVVVRPWQLYFLNDDFVHIPLSRKQVLVHFNFFRPFANLFTALDCRLWGTNGTGFHITSFILHVIATVSVFFLGKEFFTAYYRKGLTLQLPFLAALLFLVYPFHSEPLLWVIGRIVVIATIAVCWSLFFYCRRNRHFFYYLLALLFFITGLFTYESTWVVPVFITAISYYDIQKGKSTWKRELKWVAGYWLVFGLFQLIRFIVIGSVSGFYGFDGARPGIAGVTGNLFRLIFRSMVPPFANAVYFSVVCAIATVLILYIAVPVIKKATTRLPVLLLVLCCLVSYLPVVLLGISTHDSEGERYLYLPSVFGILLIVILLSEWLNVYRKVFYASMLLVLVFLVLLTVASIPYKIASRVAKTTMESLAAEKNCRNLVLVNVPTKYKGGLIFRMGLKEGIDWIVPGHPFKNIYLLSRREMANAPATFPLVHAPWQSLSGQTVHNDALQQLETFSRSNNISGFDNFKETCVFYFTDSAMVKIEPNR
jgi:hypothetical protein